MREKQDTEKDFQGLTLTDLLSDDISLRYKLDQESDFYRAWAEFVKIWYEWGEINHLQPITDFKEQTQLYLDAQKPVNKKVFEKAFAQWGAKNPQELSGEEISELVSRITEEMTLGTNETLHKKGIIAPFEHFRITVNSETFEPERYDSALDTNKASQQRVLGYVNALYKIPNGSSISWKSFRDYFEGRISAEDEESLKLTTNPDLVIGTSKLFAHQTLFIANRTAERREQLRIRRNGRPELMEAHSRLDLPRGVNRPDATELLETMQKTLLKHKEEAASLLKTHMYLTDRAYREGGDNPMFSVNMDDLLDVKGYARRSNGTFQASTYREEWGRIATLAGCWLEVNRVTETNKRGKDTILVDETPYWEVRARRRVREGEHVGFEAILLEDPSAPIVKQLVMQPGLWWAISERGSMNFHLPYEVLALPTDGRGNEVNRMAVQLAATLALWVRSSQQKHAGTAICYSVGALLEASGIKTQAEFLEEDSKTSKRLRVYLAGELDTPGGALKRLADLKAFDVAIAEEDKFWAVGRAWQNSFWDAKLQVDIPDLGIRKQLSSKVKRHTKSK